jgi:hypothetical protein
MPYRQNFPIPAVIDPPKTCLCIEIPDHPDWKRVIAGLLFELSYWFNWERTGDMSGAECAAVWKRVYNSIDWSGMSCCNGGSCCTPPAITIRVNPTTGLVEQSTDNGANWSPVAGGFQSVIVEPVPPVTSGVSATKCDAATNVAGQVDVWIDQVSNDFTTAVSLLEFGLAVCEAILIAVVTVLSLGTLTAIEAAVLPTLGAALFAAWGAGKTVFDDYWTTDIKDDILCAAYCNIGDDGSFSESQFSAFWNEVNAKLPASPAKMLFMGFLSSIGKQGLNAMAATGASADSDCGDCDCIPCSADDWSWNTDVTPEGDDVVRTSTTYEADAYHAGPFYYWVFWSPTFDCCDITVTGDFDPVTTAFCGKVTCENAGPDVYAVESDPPWTNDALFPPHGLMSAIKVRAAYPFRAKATFNV